MVKRLIQKWCSDCKGFLTFNPLGYSHDIEFNEKKSKDGENQYLCRTCKRWRWKEPHPSTIKGGEKPTTCVSQQSGSGYPWRLCMF